MKEVTKAKCAAAWVDVEAGLGVLTAIKKNKVSNVSFRKWRSMNGKVVEGRSQARRNKLKDQGVPSLFAIADPIREARQPAKPPKVTKFLVPETKDDEVSILAIRGNARDVNQSLYLLSQIFGKAEHGQAHP